MPLLIFAYLMLADVNFTTMEEQMIIICECHSYTHQAIFWWDEEDKQLSVTLHLVTYKNVFKRIWSAIKYVCGYTSNYGEWDTFLFKPEDEKKLRDYLERGTK